MPIVESELAPLRNPRLAALATSAWPAWLWSADGSHIQWANAVGAAMFGAANPAECAKRRFDVTDASAAHIIRLAATLPAAPHDRLERLRGFAAGFGHALTCACSRLVLPDGTAAILVAATEPAGPALTLHERVRRLLDGHDEALAVFAPDGTLIHANAAALARLDGATTLSALGIETLTATVLETGSASGTSRLGQAEFDVAAVRLGEDASRAVMIALTPQPSEAPSIPSPAEKTEPAPAALAAPAAPAPEAAVEAPPVAPVAPPPSSPTVAPAAADEPMPERRHPLRFVWQMDADGRFVVGSDEFIALVGPRTMAAFGRLWSEVAAELKLDPDNQVSRAVATHETWSGIVISCPVDESSERLPVELSGLPVFDRDRSFRGYRGFGVCRDIARINELARARRERPIGFMPAPEATPQGAMDPETEPAAAAAAATPAIAEAAEAAPRPERPALSVAPAAANVVPFRTPPQQQPQPAEPKSPSLSPVERRAFRELAQELTARLREPQQAPAADENGAESLPAEPREPEAAEAAAAPAAGALIEQVLLDRIPIAVLVHRLDALLYANRHFLELSGYENLGALEAAGGLNTLFAEPGAGALPDSGGSQSLSITTHGGERLPVEGRLFTVPWDGASALALILTNGQAEERHRATEAALAAAESEFLALKSALDSDAGARQEIEDELRNAKREAQRTAAAKSDFLAKVSHEIRTPLNAMTGFVEVIMAERFGPIGNERYREYLKDIHAAGTHLVSLLNDLLDLSKIETGQLELTFADVNLNELTQQCVGIMQPQANRARIIIRTSLTPGLPQIVADERSLRQIVLNLLLNSIKFTGPGGQVIVSTVFSDSHETVLRVRDTGVGMSEKDIQAALEPFRQTATSGSWGSGGTGLGLPLTKALAEANRASFSIKSAPNAGTLVEIAFPSSRVLAE
jgi:signal transduction histidine kinase/PAS domain-containing protein